MPIYLKGARAETSYRILYKSKDRYNVQYVISRFGINKITYNQKEILIMNNYIIYNQKIASKLMERGYNLLKIEKNKNKESLNIYIFKYKDGIENSLKEILNG